MTLAEAARQQIAKVRKPHWNRLCYLELFLVPPDGLGPWGTVYDPAGWAGLGRQGPTEEDKILVLGDRDDDWEAFDQGVQT